MERITEFTHRILEECGKADGIYVDFTMGGGNDTLFLCKLAPNGRVYSFDIQPAALDATQKLLDQNSISNCSLILDSHANADKYSIGKIDGGMFNLGYLPKSDKSITTKRPSTFAAVKIALNMLKVGAVLTVAVYPGHEEGRLEGEMLFDYLSSLDKYIFNVIYYRYINHPGSAFVFAIERFRPSPDLL
ncbi:MAG: 16S rRNA (cytosine(1402)-N(4))-methyltransferase [Oscillospiraceae bacterium]|nr:16S rRNA (cytosine(1402)-N(4))-methyltransferase [Oscillospiraceae bacterium]